VNSFDKDETYNRVVAIISQILTISPSTIDGTSKLEALGADSLDMLEIIIRLEEAFGVEINDEDASKITCVQDAVDKIHSMRIK